MKSVLILICVFLSINIYSQPIDKKATHKTFALFRNLKKLSENHVLFGHQHATEYGHGWRGDLDRSDIKSVCGSHPAVIGVDLGGFSIPDENALTKFKVSLKNNVKILTTGEV